MTWLRKHLLLFAAVGVLAYMLIPNLVVAMFSFNDPAGRYNYTWTAFSADAWATRAGAGHLRVARPVAAHRPHRVAHGDGARHDDRLRPGPLPVPGALDHQPAHLHADGHAEVVMGSAS